MSEVISMNMSNEFEEVEVDEIFGELLTNLVRSHPCLYDKTCTKYKDKNYVADTWASIAATCNMSSMSRFILFCYKLSTHTHIL